MKKENLKESLFAGLLAYTCVTKGYNIFTIEFWGIYLLGCGIYLGVDFILKD